MRSLLILICLIISCGVLAEENQFTRISSYRIDAVNPTPESNKIGKIFPGYRGANQLIIYTPAYGAYTGTNEYGKEATVKSGRVFSFNGANAYIPEDGYVISGHGSAKKWINQNLIEGAFIKIDPVSKTIESIITPESYLYKAEHKLNEVQKTIIHYKKNLPGYQCSYSQKYYSAAVEKNEKAKYYISRKSYRQAMREINSALSLAEKAFYWAIPAMNNEFHGIWHRPVEKNRSEIAKTLKKLKNTGIDNVFLETYYQGYTIFPSKTMEKYGAKKQRTEFHRVRM